MDLGLSSPTTHLEEKGSNCDASSNPFVNVGQLSVGDLKAAANALEDSWKPAAG